MEDIHAANLRLENPSIEGSTASKDLVDLFKLTEARYMLIDKLMDIGENNDIIHLALRWLGLLDRRDYTWLPLEIMSEDVP